MQVNITNNVLNRLNLAYILQTIGKGIILNLAHILPCRQVETLIGPADDMLTCVQHAFNNFNWTELDEVVGRTSAGSSEWEQMFAEAVRARYVLIQYADSWCLLLCGNSTVYRVLYSPQCLPFAVIRHDIWL